MTVELTVKFQEKPVAASGQYEKGEWTVLTACDKIDTVYIELDSND